MDKTQLIVDKIDKLDENVNRRLDAYNEQLQIHIEGVNTLKQMHEENKTRIEQNKEDIENLKLPAKAIKYLWNSYVIRIVTLIGAIAGIAKIISTFKG